MSRREAAMGSRSSNEDDDDDLVEDLGAVQRASHPASHGAGPGSKIAEDDDQQDVEMLKRLQATRGSGKVSSKIEDRESEFQKRKFDRVADGVLAGTYEERMKAAEEDGKSQAQAQAQGQAAPSQAEPSVSIKPSSQEDGFPGAKTQRKRRRRWDDPGPSAAPASASNGATSATDAYLSSDMETARGTGSETEAGAGRKETSTRRRRWDATPEDVAQATAQNILNGAADGTAAQATAGAPQPLQTRWERDLAARNRELSDAELDKLLPTEGYIVVPPPHGYAPKNKGSRKLLAAPDQDEGGEGTFTLPEEGSASARAMEVQLGVAGGEEVVTADGTTLPPMRKEDMAFFSKLMDSADQTKLDPEEVKERKILALLLKIKNGLPSQRKAALRQITNKARVFGAKALFHQILPLLMSPSLEDQERHLLVKVVDRVLYRLDDLVRPYTQNILVVIEPMLIDTDYYARVEAREIIANLSKAAGLTTMLSTIRPDISNPDDYVRNATSRALAVVASALGVPAMLPFLKAVCQSRKSWQARHTGVKTVQQISILLGCSILPFLTELVSIVASGLNDQEQKVRTMTALALASLAESAHPYGIESFDPVLEPLWRGVRQHQGRTLAAFLKAIGNIIPLMYDDENASYFTKQVMAILIREFRSSEDEMRMIVLTVVKQCVSTDGVAASYVRSDVVPDFISAFWTRRSALDFRTYRQVVETTVELANKVGGAHVIEKLVTLLRDENEPLRRMTTECIMKVLENLGATDVNLDLEVQLIDGALFAFQEQAASILASAMATSADGAANNALGERESLVMLNGFATIVNALGIRVKPYLTQIASTIKFRLNNKDALVRGQAAELVARIANVMAVCGEDHLMAHLGVVLFESLGEEYPATLASVLAGLRGIVAVIGMKRMQPPVKDLIPRLTPILRNQNQKVQENTIDLIGRVADRGAEFVSAREWMRICFELIEMLRAKRKAIRRASASTFGYIAKAIGPSDILHVLLGNLRVQDRTMRVCTTVSLAIVAESCGPFTVLPALLNEYRVTDINVQNGCLKALSFVFEYIGEMSKDYIYSTVTLLEDALTDKDAVHRQTACTVVKHLALGVQGAGCEDALTHLLNFVWPNIFETSPHVIGAVLSAIEGIRVSLGPQRVMMYVLQGLFHPARKVREVFWKVYNNLYVYSGHAIVPSYPRLEDDYVIQVDPSTPSLDAKKLALKKVLLDDAGPRKVRNSYRRTHLELFL